MKRTSRVLSALLAALLFIGAFDASGATKKKGSVTRTTATVSAPDFKYPKKVITTADAMLARGLREGNDPLIMQALIEKSSAMLSINSDSINAVVDLLSQTGQKVSGQVGRAMIDLLEANCLAKYYEEKRWIYDARTMPAEPVPADIRQWSGQLFRSRINALISRTVDAYPALAKVKITTYKSVISQDGLTAEFYPTLLDFVASNSIDILEILSTNNRLPLPVEALTGAIDLSSRDCKASEIEKLMAKIANRWVSDAATSGGARMEALLNRNSVAYRMGNFELNQYVTSLWKLYKENENSEYSGLALESICIHSSYCYRNENCVVDSETVAEALRLNLKRFPAFALNNSLKIRLMDIERKMVDANFPETVLPGVPFKIKLDCSNVYEGQVQIVKVPLSAFVNGKDYENVVTSFPVVKTLPFSSSVRDRLNTVAMVDCKIDEPGYYVLVVKAPDLASQARLSSYSVISVSDIAVGIVNSENCRNDSAAVLVYSLIDGSPVAGAQVHTYPHGYDSTKNSSPTLLGTTDNDGVLKVPSESRYYTRGAVATKGTMSSPLGNFYTLRRYDCDRKQSFVSWSLAFGRPIYHPGDSVDFAGNFYRQYPDGRYEVLANHPIKIQVEDANYQTIMTEELTTDEWGRIEGKFGTTKESLTGYYRVLASPQNLGDNEIEQDGSHNSVMISDYKLPTYFIDNLHAVNNIATTGEVIVEGRAVSYSGFPMADIPVEAKLQFQEDWWRDSRDIDEVGAYKVQTDESGIFSISLPAYLLQSRKYKNGFFTVIVTATSSTGETQSADTRFTVGYKYLINTTGGYDVNGDEKTKLDISVVDMDGVSTPSLVDYTVLSGDKVLISEQFNVPNPTVDFSSLPSGTYTIRLALPDTTLAATVTVNLIVYRKSDTVSPIKDTPVWFPIETLTVDKGETATFGYEAARAGLTLTVASVTGDKKPFEIQHIVTRAGYNELAFRVEDEMAIEVVGCDSLRNVYERLTVSIAKPSTTLKIETETFRDRVTPGNVESWKFRVAGPDGEAVTAAVMLNMFNKSLEQVQPYNWLDKVHNFFPSRQSLTVSILEIRSMASRWQQKLVYPDFRDITTPGFLYINRALLGMRGVVREYKYERVVSVNAVATADFDAAPMPVASKAMQDAVEEAAEVDAGGGNAIAEATPAQPMYRDREVAQALFEPMLTTDSRGNLAIGFTVPNANTTWALRMMAFTREMLQGEFAADIVASKQVMVQPNLPRFLRNGDHAVVSSMVMNNTDTAQMVATKVEIFDPSTGKVVSIAEAVDQIPARGSKVVKSTIDVPADASCVGFRVRSVMGGNSDGEQSLLPVLAAEQPVIESNRFFMAPDQKSYSTDFGATRQGETTLLTFCENPAWEVVSALPGLQAEEPTSAFGAAYAMFSAAVARGLMKDNPAIAAELQRWLASDQSDSTLVSMLERNQELKTFMLNATPWVQAAQSDTERMTRLALLFDNNQVNAVIDRSIATLGKLSAGGGWKWISMTDQPSLWVTEEVLTVLGRLNELGYLPADKKLSTMITNAIDYTDRETVAAYRQSPKGSYLGWAAMRSYFKDRKMSSAAQRVNEAEVQKAIAEWGDMSLEGKAWAGLLLAANGYSNTAGEIVKSLREFSETTPAKGTWWPRLDDSATGRRLRVTGLISRLYKAVGAPQSELDGIAQWLIGEKQTQNWGTAATTTDVIADILNTSRTYFAKAGSVSVSVNGNTVELPRFDNAIGSFKLNLGTLAPQGGTLVVARGNASPSWGAVMTMRRAEMSEIKAASAEGLAIEKHLYKVENTADGEKVTEAPEFKVGDLVRVELVITVDRELDYIAIDDNRAACLEPVEQTPAPIWQDGVCFYRENRDATTNIFVTRLRHGVYRLSYDMRANNAGTYSMGITTAQSQYAPDATAHSAGGTLRVRN